MPMLSRRRAFAVMCLVVVLALFSITPPSSPSAGAAAARSPERGAPLPPGWQVATYGGAPAPAAAGQPSRRIPSYRVGVPPGWTARLWPDTRAGYGQLDLDAPSGDSIDLLLLPLRPGAPTLPQLLTHDARFLFGAARDHVRLPLGTAVRLTGLATPPRTGRVSQMLYVPRGNLVYRLVAAHAPTAAAQAMVLQVAATLRVPAPPGSPSHVPRPLPPPAPPAEACCHCPAWGDGWGTLLTRLDGIAVYSNGGDLANGCLGAYGVPYQCVELVQRYVALRWGYPPVWRGVGGAADMRWAHPAGIQFVPNGGAPGPREGDALLFYGGDVGHVALVQRVDRVRGQISVVEENWSTSGRATLPLYGDARATTTTIGVRNSAYGSYTVAGWLHSPKNVSAAPLTA